MSGSPKNSKTDNILQAVKNPPDGGDFLWDGKDEDDRPLSRKEMKDGIAAAKRRRGRPPGSNKVSTTIRFDRDIIEAFKDAGPGWQSRMNAALRDWLKDHSPG